MSLLLYLNLNISSDTLVITKVNNYFHLQDWGNYTPYIHNLTLVLGHKYYQAVDIKSDTSVETINLQLGMYVTSKQLTTSWQKYIILYRLLMNLL